jgi:hypothetical protein
MSDLNFGDINASFYHLSWPQFVTHYKFRAGNSEMPLSESPSGMGLEVNFKFRRLLSIVERHCDRDLPRPVFRGMSNFPRIMATKSILQIVSQPDIMTRRIRLPDKKVNGREFHEETT